MENVVVKTEIDESMKEEGVDISEISYEDKLKFVNRIAQPMASKKLAKKVYKCIKKGEFFQLFFINAIISQ